MTRRIAPSLRTFKWRCSEGGFVTGHALKFRASTPFIVNSSKESQGKVAASQRLRGTLNMTRYRIQVWCDVSGDKAYILDSFDSHGDAERAAKMCCAGLPYSFEIEEEAIPDYEALVA
jgi:hypothetical protein